MASRKQAPKVAVTKSKPNVVVFRLDDLPAARHAVAAFDLPEPVQRAPFYAHGIEAKGRSKLFQRVRETPLPGPVVKRGFALCDALIELIALPDESPIGEDQWSRGFHADATYAQMVESFEADGFQVLTIAELAARTAKPRAVEASRTKLARAAKALSKEVPASTVTSVVRWLEEGGEEPDVPASLLGPLASILLDEAIETWGPMEDRLFALAAKRRTLGALAEDPASEGIGIDRWGLLSERLARAGWSPQEIEDAWLDGMLGERDWASAKWFAMSFLPRLETTAQHILGRNEVDPSPALTRLLCGPFDDLPGELDPLYKKGVRAFLEGSPVARSLGRDVWERLAYHDEKAFAKAARKARPKPEPQTTLPVGSASKLAELADRYGFPFPDEILDIWDLASSLSPKDPTVAFAEEDDLGISLVGPFDLLAGRTRVKKGLDVRLHYRYRFDPPEFLTVATGNVDRLHFGYWYDDPAAGAACIASYYVNDAYEISVPGRTLWEALRRSLESAWAGIVENMAEDRQHADSYTRTLARLAILRDRIMERATRDRPEIGDVYREKYDLHALRTRQATVDTPEKMGIVVPPEKYKPLSAMGDDLRKALAGKASKKRIVKEALALAEDGFPGGALIVGRWCWAKQLDDEAYTLLDAAYAGLDRPALREVLAVHRVHRDLPSVDVLGR